MNITFPILHFCLLCPAFGEAFRFLELQEKLLLFIIYSNMKGEALLPSVDGQVLT